jgi:hypothetical protein
MKTNQYEKIEAYEGLLEELKLQQLELSVARDLARRMEATLRQRLQKPSPPRRRLYYHKHLDMLLEGISVLERGSNAVSNNIDYYQSRFEQYLTEVEP